jgi:hypothetical protein
MAHPRGHAIDGPLGRVSHPCGALAVTKPLAGNGREVGKNMAAPCEYPLGTLPPAEPPPGAAPWLLTARSLRYQAGRPGRFLIPAWRDRAGGVTIECVFEGDGSLAGLAPIEPTGTYRLVRAVGRDGVRTYVMRLPYCPGCDVDLNQRGRGTRLNWRRDQTGRGLFEVQCQCGTASYLVNADSSDEG